MLGNTWKMESGWAALSAAGQRAHTAGSGPKRLPNEAQPLTASECELRKKCWAFLHHVFVAPRAIRCLYIVNFKCSCCLPVALWAILVCFRVDLS